MPLTNIFGYSQEDTYYLNGNENEKATRNSNEIVISCAHKRRRVHGYLSQGIKITGIAEWEEMFGGGIMALSGSVIDSVNKLDQLGLGSTLQQPWMNRKFYKTSKPFSLNFGINFVAEANAELEVFAPCQALLSFVYPRKSEVSALEAAQKIVPDMRKKGQKNDKGEEVQGSIAGNLLGDMYNYYIPGPSINYGSEGAESRDVIGDPVTLVIGSTFAFGAVYMENVDVEFSSAFDPRGYPLGAKVTVKATCMDVNSCKNNGDFLISEFANGNISGLADAIESGKLAVEQFAGDVKNAVDAYVGFWRTAAGGAK